MGKQAATKKSKAYEYEKNKEKKSKINVSYTECDMINYYAIS